MSGYNDDQLGPVEANSDNNTGGMATQTKHDQLLLRAAMEDFEKNFQIESRQWVGNVIPAVLLIALRWLGHLSHRDSESEGDEVEGEEDTGEDTDEDTGEDSEEDSEEEDEEEVLEVLEVDEVPKRERWDCESILRWAIYKLVVVVLVPVYTVADPNPL